MPDLWRALASLVRPPSPRLVEVVEWRSRCPGCGAEARWSQVAHPWFSVVSIDGCGCGPVEWTLGTRPEWA